MKDLPIFLGELKALEDLRNGVPTYVFFGGTTYRNLVKIRTDLMTQPPENEIDIILESAGGLADDAYRLIHAFRKKYEIVNIVVPLFAKSAATLFALGASNLILHKYGELGPIDVQIRKEVETDPEGEWSSALNVRASLLEIENRSIEGMLAKFIELRSKDKKGKNSEVLKIGRKHLAEMLMDYSAKFYRPLLDKVDTIELGGLARSLDEGKMYAKRILKQYTKTDDERINSLINFLVYDCPEHGYVVDYDVLQSYLSYVKRSDESPFGIKYNEELEKLSIHLMKTVIRIDEEVIGFLRDLTPKEESVKIEFKDEKQQNEKQSTTN